MTETPLHTDNPWQKARDHLHSLGRIPPVFTLAVRSLMSDHYKGQAALSPASIFLVNRLMLSPSMKSVIYHAVLTFHSESVVNTPYLASADLIRKFPPADLASIIAGAYYYRLFKRKLHARGDDSAWVDISRRVLDDFDLGGFIGSCIHTIGAGVGIVSSGFLSLAQSLFLLMDVKSAEPYLSHSALEGVWPDLEYELETWGCTSAQIAGNMMQQIGFGMPWMNAAINSYSYLHASFPLSEHPTDEYFLKMRYALFWIETLRTTGQAPMIKIPADFYPPKQELFRLLYLAGQVSEQGSKYSWASRIKEDIVPSQTPQLYQEYLAESAPSEELRAFCENNISADLMEDLGDSDFEQLTKRSDDSMDF